MILWYNEAEQFNSVDVLYVYIYIKNGGFIMAYVITNECVSCGTCADECPQSCIAAGDDIYVINAEECVDCGSCADACPTDAIVAG